MNQDPSSGNLEPRGLPVTDVDRARNLVKAHGTELRYCHPWHTWLFWDGTRWKRDGRGDAYRLAVQVAEGALDGELAALEDAQGRMRHALAGRQQNLRQRAKGDARRAEQAIRQTNQGLSDRAITAALHLAQCGLPIMPEDLDQDPWLLNVENGTMDLHTGDQRPHRRQDFLTKMAGCSFDPDARCPRWDEFLLEIFESCPELVEFTQRTVGYCLTGSTDEQVWFLLHGSGANGKGVFTATLLSLFGDYGRAVASEVLLAKRGESHPTEIANLAGARLVVTGETNEGCRFDAAKIKALTGSDRLSARRMREDYWEFAPTHKLAFHTNHMPLVRDTSHAFWRRVRLIPFAARFWRPDEAPPEGSLMADPKLNETLKKELPGILNWALEGLSSWRAEGGLDTPLVVRQATSSLRMDQDAVGRFIDEKCRLGPFCTVAKKELFQRFTAWAEEAGEYPLSQRAVSLRLQERGLSSSQAPGTRARIWIGIALTDPNIP